MNHLGSIAGLLIATLSACNGAVAGSSLGDAAPPGDASTDARPSDGGACASGSITFTFRAEDPATYCIGAPSSCADVWLTILGADGREVVIDRPCLADCADCQPYGCPASCAAPQHMTAAGVTRTWDGTYYASGTCGASLACVQPSCISRGTYTARMCAYPDVGASMPNGICSPAETPKCTDVAFDWPPAATVEGSLGATDCCPASWLMYACAYSDGGSGFACHNPALGCASSTACGQGCDAVVRGRCDGG
jgi:hypothetical protein